jgi:uracil-DNA glycosylase family protein
MARKLPSKLPTKLPTKVGPKASVPTAAPFVPASRNLAVLRDVSQTCRGCDLWKLGTQTVFGEGTARAKVMFIGEQPGDKEDLSGKPFVGPAGKLLDRALAEAGIDRSEVYVTNAVKHFKWEPRGKRRIHKKPNAIEINACRPWLDAELEAVKPEAIVCLGATAAQALLGRDFRLTKHRGEAIPSPLAPLVTATVHPSAPLRAPDDESRHREIEAFIADIRAIGTMLRRGERKAA